MTLTAICLKNKSIDKMCMLYVHTERDQRWEKHSPKSQTLRPRIFAISKNYYLIIAKTYQRKGDTNIFQNCYIFFASHFASVFALVCKQ